MKVKTGVKAGGWNSNHNEAQARDAHRPKGPEVNSGDEAGGRTPHHGEAQGGLKIQSGIKAGAKKLYVGNSP
jgi:hypothetical protein